MSCFHSVVPVFLVIVLPSGATAGAQTSIPTRTPTIDQSLEIHSVSSPRISPDGLRVVYEQTRTNWESNAFETDLWMADAASGERHLLTVASKSSTDAAWSPNGRWIAFLSDRPAPLSGSPADKNQVYVMPAAGGEAQQLTKMEKGVNAFEWAPDSSRIAIAAEAPDTKAMKDRKESFGEYHVLHADYEMVHLWLVDLPKTDAAGRRAANGDPKLLNAGDSFSVDSFTFSPDGKRIAFSAQRDPDLISGFSADIYTVAVADGAVKKIVDTPGPDSDPQWSPDGAQIAYVTANGSKFFFYTNARIAVVGSEGGTPHVLSSAFDGRQSAPLGPGGNLFLCIAEDCLFFIPARPQDRNHQADRDAGNRDRLPVLLFQRLQACGLPGRCGQPLR
jgi:Tol biopolymer transport system component